jgi:hypothetical protein
LLLISRKKCVAVLHLYAIHYPGHLILNVTLRTQNDLLLNTFNYSSLETQTRVFSAIFLLNFFASSLLNDTYIAYTERFINTFKFRNKDSGILSYIFAQFLCQLLVYDLTNKPEVQR